MADSLSPLLNLVLMGDGLHFNTWGDQANANLTILENTIAGNSIIPVTGSAMTLTILQTNGAILTFTGVLTANTIITLPSVPGKWIVSNQTTGAFSLSLQAGALTPIVVPASTTSTHVFYTDGQNVFDASQSTITVAAAITAAIATYLPPGAVQEFAMSAPPSGWYECDGTAKLRTGMPPAGDAPLFANIGTTWGPGDGSTTFNLPWFQGVFRRGWDHGRGSDPGRAFASFQADNFASHTHIQSPHNHPITDPGHVHSYNQPSGASSYGSGATFALNTAPSGSTISAVTGITINNTTAINQATGGTETTVKNYATLVCIRR